MTKEELKRLYKEKVLPESKNPYHFEKMEEADSALEAYNPMCGDKYVIWMKNKQGVIDRAAFTGIGCAISKASISLMLRNIEGMNEAEALDFCKKFLLLLEEEEVQLDLPEEALNVLVSLKDFEGRMDCVKLGWESLIKFIEK